MKTSFILVLFFFFIHNTYSQADTTKIHLPCFNERLAKFKVSVETNDGQRFYNINTFEAHPDAFNTVYTEDE